MGEEMPGNEEGELRVMMDRSPAEDGKESCSVVNPPAIFFGAATGAIVGGAVGVLLSMLV